MKNFLTFLFIFYFTSAFSQSIYQEQICTSINFQGGGFVTSVVGSSDGKILYLRTDIGGVYKKINGGDWKFIGQYALTPAALMVQGICINPFNPDELIIACGDHHTPEDSERGLWRSADAGSNWQHVLGANTGNPVINFGGNKFDIKIGGQCIYYHPKIKGIVYTGGLDLKSGSRIYISSNSGMNFYDIKSSKLIKGDIVSIKSSIYQPNEIWAGTNSGLYISRDFGNSWTGPLYKNKIKKVYNILIYDSSTVLIAGGGLYKISDGKISDITGRLNNFHDEIISVAHFGSTLAVSGIHSSVCYSTDGGNSWSEGTAPELDTIFNPKHSLKTEDKIYSLKIFSESTKSPLYIAGGSGAYISENNGLLWRYNNPGLNLTVVYKSVFSRNGLIFLPLSDWGMARTSENLVPGILDYSRNYTLVPPPPENNGDTYIPNVTRCLISKTNINHIYIIGGSVYSYYPVMAESFENGNENSFTIMTPKGLQLYPDYKVKASLIDGAVTSQDGKNDNLILLTGGGEKKVKISDNENLYGVRYSTDNGHSFNKSIFKGKSKLKYLYSGVEDLFSRSNNLAVDRFDASIVYLYLEGGNFIRKSDTIYGGGFFKSTDAGRNFEFVSSVVKYPETEYRFPACLSLNQSENYFLIAMENKGLFISTNKGSSWEQMEGWISAQTCDSKGDVIITFGKRKSDKYNYLYISKDNGKNWTRIYFRGLGTVPSVRSIDINPYFQEAWISTGGQGTLIYKY